MTGAPLLAAALFFMPLVTQAQLNDASSPEGRGVGKFTATVPFVGCQSDGSLPVPTAKPVAVDLPSDVASKLAAYSADGTSWILAPRGWHCMHLIQASFIVIAPTEYNFNSLNRTGTDIDEPMVAEQSYDFSDQGSGDVTLGLAYQFFPKVFAGVDLDFIEAGGVPSLRQQIKSGQYFKTVPTDQLNHLNSDIVEYGTLSRTSGIGGQFLGPWTGAAPPQKLIPSAYGTSGFIGLFFISDFKTPLDNLKGVSIVGVRLPNNLEYLSRYILESSEKDFEKSNHLP